MAASNGGRRGGLFHRRRDEAGTDRGTRADERTQQYPNAPAAPPQGEGYPAQQYPNGQQYPSGQQYPDGQSVGPNQEQYGTNRPR